MLTRRTSAHMIRVPAARFSELGGLCRLEPFEQLDEHPIRISRNDGSNRPEGVRLLGQKGYASFPHGRRCRIDIRHAKRETIDAHVVQSRIRLARGGRVQPLHQVDEHFAGCVGRG